MGSLTRITSYVDWVNVLTNGFRTTSNSMPFDGHVNAFNNFVLHGNDRTFECEVPFLPNGNCLRFRSNRNQRACTHVYTCTYRLNKIVAEHSTLNTGENKYSIRNAVYFRAKDGKIAIYLCIRVEISMKCSMDIAIHTITEYLHLVSLFELCKHQQQRKKKLRMTKNTMVIPRQ